MNKTLEELYKEYEAQKLVCACMNDLIQESEARIQRLRAQAQPIIEKNEAISKAYTEKTALIDRDTYNLRAKKLAAIDKLAEKIESDKKRLSKMQKDFDIWFEKSGGKKIELEVKYHNLINSINQKFFALNLEGAEDTDIKLKNEQDENLKKWDRIRKEIEALGGKV